MTIIISLVIAGILLLGAEILLPGIIAGVIGLGCLLAATVCTWIKYGAATGAAMFGGELLLGLILFLVWLKFFPKSKIGRALTLTASSAPAPEPAPDAITEGTTGRTSSLLRPAGTATINGRRVDVISEGQPIAPGTDIKVVKVEGSRIIVRKLWKIS